MSDEAEAFTAYCVAVEAGASPDERHSLYERWTDAMKARIAAEREPDPRDAEIARLRDQIETLEADLEQAGKDRDYYRDIATKLGGNPFTKP